MSTRGPQFSLGMAEQPGFLSFSPTSPLSFKEERKLERAVQSILERVTQDEQEATEGSPT